MQAPLQWLESNHEQIIRNLAELVAVPSISTDGEHTQEIERSAQLTCDQMRAAGLPDVQMIRVDNSLPYAFGQWCEAADKPTVFLYAHHDVQPVNFPAQWQSDPWKLTRRDGRLYGRGSADDKVAIAAQLGAIGAYMKTVGELPVNVKVVVEGEEEIGSKNLDSFFDRYKDQLASDVIVVTDTENIEVGLPSLTYSLRGVVTLEVEVRTGEIPVHSGSAGGALPDAALALNKVLGKLYWDNGPLPIPGFYDKVRPLTDKERQAFAKLAGDEAGFREELKLLPDVRFSTEAGYHAREATWRRPSVTVIAQEASSIRRASNQVLPSAKALLSCRIVPDQDPQEVVRQISEYLRADAPWDATVTVKELGASVRWWMTDPNGPAFEAAMGSLRKGFDRDPVAVGCGGTIGFVGPLAELFGGAPALLFGIEDPASNAHAPNESVHEGDMKKLMASLVHLFEGLGKLSPDRVK